MTKFHVEYDFEGEAQERSVVEGWKSFKLDTRSDAGAWLINSFPPGAVITELEELPLVAGWYQLPGQSAGRRAKGIYYWEEDEIDSYPRELFYQEFRRVKDPEPYVEASTDVFRDGYYLSSGGYTYRRLDGIWSFKSDSGGWVTSMCEDIDLTGHLTWEDFE